MSAAPEEAAAAPLSPAPAKLRYSKLWWGIGWLLIVAVIWGSLDRPTGRQLPFDAGDKVIHFFAYWCMTIWFSGVLARRRYPWLALWLMAFGGAIELMQGAMGFGRDADWRDMVANGAGIVTALAVAYAGLGSWIAVIERRLGSSTS
jgi:VanZ family protein